jgi:hypothetical protein
LADGVKEGGLEFIGSRIPSYKSKGKPIAPEHYIS